MTSPDISFLLNVGGLAAGMVGTILIYFFGVPRQIDTGGRMSLELEQENEHEKERIGEFKRLGATGLALVFLAFTLQLVAAVITAMK